MNYVIAASRPWYWGLGPELQEHFARPFATVQREQDLDVAKLRKLQPRYVFFPHWSAKIPEEIFDRFECVVFHMTDLPFGRGGSPLQNLIARGIYETRISALRCSPVLDGGPIYLKRPLSLEGNAEEIYVRAAGVIGKMIAYIVKHEPAPVPQTGQPTVFRRRTPEESDMASLADLRKVFDHIRMLDAKGYPHAFVETEHLRLEFRRASLSTDSVQAEVTIKRKL
jgi:methionyl-tRNA formyltransferase